MSGNPAGSRPAGRVYGSQAALGRRTASGFWRILISVLAVGCAREVAVVIPVPRGTTEPALVFKAQIVADAFGRLEREWYHHEERDRNVAKLLKDSSFREADLNDDGTPEVVVKLSWRSQGLEGISDGFDLLRGQFDDGPYFVYASGRDGPRFMGEIGGRSWRVLSSRHKGFRDIKTRGHWSASQENVLYFGVVNGRYELLRAERHTYMWEEDRSLRLIKREELKSWVSPSCR